VAKLPLKDLHLPAKARAVFNVFVLSQVKAGRAKMGA